MSIEPGFDKDEAIEMMRLCYAADLDLMSTAPAADDPIDKDGANLLPSPIHPIWPSDGGWVAAAPGSDTWAGSILDSALENRALVARATQGRYQGATVVAFRGTKTLLNFLEDADLAMVSAGPIDGSDKTYLSGDWTTNARAEIHQGFRLAFESLDSDLTRPTSLSALLGDAVAESGDVYVTGHSLGGPMAALCAAWLRAGGLGRPVGVKCYTFASPKLGNDAFASSYELSLSNHGRSFRVANSLDTIPQIPLTIQLASDLNNPAIFNSMLPKFLQRILKALEALTLPSTLDFHHVGQPVILDGTGPIEWTEDTFPPDLFDPPRQGVPLSTLLPAKIIQPWWQHWMWNYLSFLLALDAPRPPQPT